MALAEPWESHLTTFQKLLFLRCLRPDKALAGIQAYVSHHLGQRFIEPPPFDLATCFKESVPSTPLVFVLSAGTGHTKQYQCPVVVPDKHVFEHRITVSPLDEHCRRCACVVGYDLTQWTKIYPVCMGDGVVCSITSTTLRLCSGADPMADLLKLAEEMKFSKKFEKVSLGQGQGPKAERLLEAGMERGLWVCLQNCHLAVSWMPALERIIQNIQPDKVGGGLWRST